VGKRKDDKPSEARTTFPIYAVDSLDLRQLSAMLDISIPDVYRRLLAPVAKAALLAEVRRKATELGKDRT